MDRNPIGMRKDPWRDALDGLGLLQTFVVGTLIFGIVGRFVLGRAALAGAIVQVLMSVIFALVLLAGLARWRNIPPETRAQGLANVAHVGAWVNLIGSLLSAVMVVLVLGKSIQTMSAIATWTTGLLVITGFGALLYHFGFLLSARTVALFCEARDVAGYATATLVTGLGTVILTIAGASTSSHGGGVALLVCLGILAIVTVVLFLVLLSGLRRAITSKPSPADAF